MSDSWANGENGYLKRDYVVDLMEAAGFELAAESNINANDKDQPTESEYVWRLPPNLGGAEDDSDKMAAMNAIGESNRMTLKFVKP
jgi:predicted methyltransferase